MEYDGLNRVTKATYPEDVDSERKELITVYNRSGALERVLLDDQVYVDRIAYNAKGQKLLMTLGKTSDDSEGIMTRYLYRDDNFRLLRLKSEKYERSIDGNEITYEKQSGTVKQNFSYQYDLSGNIVSIKDTTTDSGYGMTPDELTRKFAYDPLYRLLSATGRETAATESLPWEDVYRPQDRSAARAYRQLYTYDKLGNIQELQHIAASGNFTRAFSYIDGRNQLETITVGSDEYDFDHDVNGNIISEGDTARHLEYDYADRLKVFSVQTGTSEPSKYAIYLYDAGGQRTVTKALEQDSRYTAENLKKMYGKGEEKGGSLEGRSLRRL